MAADGTGGGRTGAERGEGAAEGVASGVEHGARHVHLAALEQAQHEHEYLALDGAALVRRLEAAVHLGPAAAADAALAAGVLPVGIDVRHARPHDLRGGGCLGPKRAHRGRVAATHTDHITVSYPHHSHLEHGAVCPKHSGYPASYGRAARHTHRRAARHTHRRARTPTCRSMRAFTTVVVPRNATSTHVLLHATSALVSAVRSQKSL